MPSTLVVLCHLTLCVLLCGFVCVCVCMCARVHVQIYVLCYSVLETCELVLAARSRSPSYAWTHMCLCDPNGPIWRGFLPLQTLNEGTSQGCIDFADSYMGLVCHGKGRV